MQSILRIGLVRPSGVFWDMEIAGEIEQPQNLLAFGVAEPAQGMIEHHGVDQLVCFPRAFLARRVPANGLGLADKCFDLLAV